jgi:uncharacterized protein (TIGR03067 family)
LNTALVGLAILVGAPIGKPEPKSAVQPSLVGAWTIESYLVDGKLEDHAGTTMELTVQGRVVARKDGKVEDEGRFRAAPARDSAEFDWMGDDDCGRVPGIYRFDGDLLLLCFNTNPAGTRPSIFDAPRGSGCALITFKRVAKK